jgi:putative ABC transport system substrate-binding protein
MYIASAAARYVRGLGHKLKASDGKGKRTVSSSRRFFMSKKILIPLLVAFVLASTNLAQAQQTKVYRAGVVFEGGAFYEIVDGLKDGLKELGFVEGMNLILEVRDLKGDRNSADRISRSLEREKVDLLYVISTSVVSVVKQATAEVPIVFAVGADPVVAGLVESFAKPGRRLTGVHYLAGDLTAKRLEILKAVVPELRRAVTFYNPSNEVALRAANRRERQQRN